ncbi:hypothetical protein PAMP_011293 [Pampus punctatissimus]
MELSSMTEQKPSGAAFPLPLLTQSLWTCRESHHSSALWLPVSPLNVCFQRFGADIPPCDPGFVQGMPGNMRAEAALFPRCFIPSAKQRSRMAPPGSSSSSRGQTACQSQLPLSTSRVLAWIIPQSPINQGNTTSNMAD